MATKYRLRKLDVAPNLIVDFRSELATAGFTELDVNVAHGLLAGQFEDDHKDPFDRMLIAQAQIERLTLVSNEAAFDRFGIQRLW
jgi:PIN domain nuclease of toxin-antitoxin system